MKRTPCLALATTIAAFMLGCTSKTKDNTDTDTDTDTDTNAVGSIEDVLSPPCDDGGAPSSSAPDGTDLHRVTLDAFPDARCNDGTPAVMYIRAAESEENANRWVVWTEGGSLCRNYTECRARWCGTAAPYDAGKMSSSFSPASIGAKGIFNRDYTGFDNPLGDANQVRLHYCSSDSWAGQADDVLLEDPEGVGEPFLVQFRGHAIMEAVMTALLEGVSSDEVDGGVAETLPPMSEATEVLLTGSSAGSTGLAHNLDWMTQQLPETASVGAILDARMYPVADFIDDPDFVDFYEAGQVAEYEDETALRDLFRDESCMDAHPTDPHRCQETSHVRLHHLTTPYLQVMDLVDSKVIGFYAKIYEQMGQPVNLENVEERNAFLAKVVPWNRSQMLALADIPTQAEEASAIDRPVGAFSQLCQKHTLLEHNAYYFKGTIEGTEGAPRSANDVISAWSIGADISLIDTPLGSTSVCPDN